VLVPLDDSPLEPDVWPLEPDDVVPDEPVDDSPLEPDDVVPDEPVDDSPLEPDV
jgi:hypothetical protein